MPCEGFYADWKGGRVILVTNKSESAPIALFVYNRLRHARLTVEALLANVGAEQSHIHIFSDAPKNAAASQAVTEVRSYIRSITGFKSITIVERKVNFGLAQSITNGVTRLCSEYGRVVVMEDDIVTSPYFLKYMNEALDLYQGDEQVASIHGYCYPVQEKLPETFFLKGADCWGWATWSRAWAHFEPDGRHLLKQLVQRKLSRDFDFDGQYPYTRMLRGQIAGRNDSWAIRWHASCFLRDMLTLYPGRSLVENIGNDNSGTHCAPTEVYSGALDPRLVKVERIALEPSVAARAAFVDFFWNSREGLFQKVLRRVVRPLRR